MTDHSFVVRLPARASPAIGETLRIGWDASAAHWFDLSTQCRIDR
jgi:hypothetical protein